MVLLGSSWQDEVRLLTKPGPLVAPSWSLPPGMAVSLQPAAPQFLSRFGLCESHGVHPRGIKWPSQKQTLRQRQHHTRFIRGITQIREKESSWDRENIQKMGIRWLFDSQAQPVPDS